MNALPERWWVLTPVRPTVTGVDTGLVPDPYASLEAWARYHHYDLDELDDVGLWIERRRIEYAIIGGRRQGWLLERLKRLAEEQKRRRQGGR